MSIAALVAALPQINSRRVAEDLIRELRIKGLKIVPDDGHAAAAAKLCKCGSDPERERVIPRTSFHEGSSI